MTKTEQKRVNSGRVHKTLFLTYLLMEAALQTKIECPRNRSVLIATESIRIIPLNIFCPTVYDYTWYNSSDKDKSRPSVVRYRF